jgi:endogenous inhibitor of DNA gyrase (YacG/DUF329 family)
MAYVCPRCGKTVQRGGAEAAKHFGAVGVLLVGALGGVHCRSCGKISQSEFPPEVRSKMIMGSAALAVVAVGLVVGVIWLLSVV